MAKRTYLKQRSDNGVWRVAIYDTETGCVSYQTTHSRDRDEAEKFYQKWLLESSLRLDLTGATIPEVMVRYWNTYGKDLASRETVQVVVGLCGELLDGVTVPAFTSARQEEFLDEIDDIAPATQRRYLGVIHAAIQRGISREEIACAGPRKYRVLGDDGEGASPFGIADLRKLCSAAVDRHQQRFLTLAMGTLSRPIALLDLTTDRVRFDEGVIKLQNPDIPANKKRRPTVPMSSVLANYLRDTLDGYGLVVHGKDGAKIGSHRTMFRRLGERAGVTGTAYGIRKAGAMWLRRMGVPEMDLKGMLGHSLGGETDRYAHMAPGYMEAVKVAIDALFAAVRPSWLASYLPPKAETSDEAVDNLLKGLSGVVGATGIEPVTPTMSRNLNLTELPYFPVLRAANDD